MPSKKIVLIGFQEQDNLGIGYLAAVLVDNGFQVEILDFLKKPDFLYQAVRAASPLLVGFSIIFQYYIREFAALVIYLRDRNITCHFCAGGHYPSLQPKDLLDSIAGLDSVVRFEGEYALLDLAQKLYQGERWQDIQGITYRRGSQIVNNELRPLIEDLDVLPFPIRKTHPIDCLGTNIATVLASRGCIRNCSFCSIRKFYQVPPGKIRRLRNPANVVDEMHFLFEKNGTKIFFFQDDDFPVAGKQGHRWTTEFIAELHDRNLADKCLWKINCRSDEVDYELFLAMKRAGLFLVYLGIESGNELGLRVLNKRYSVGKNIEAVDTLKRLDLLYDFGFMLFDPSSSFQSVDENIGFLRTICADGSSPAGFCKMVPYVATDIKERLEAEGRLKGEKYRLDYDFQDVRLDMYYISLRDTFGQWMFRHEGFLNRLKWARYEVEVIRKYFSCVEELDLHKAFVKYVVAAGNGIFFTIAEELLKVFASSDGTPDKTTLIEFQDIVLSRQHQLLMELLEETSSFFESNDLSLGESKISSLKQM